MRLPAAEVTGSEAALATIAPSNRLGGRASREISVPVARLDDFQLPPIGFIKIDVEGHEEAVLQGARETIGRNRPALMIEIEERHNRGAIERVFDHFRSDGY
ncbi:MAG TPA: FkbM family methyltransferase [Caulobacteraceae bacterium]|nr:FkbM family methyltransferase [Caulobacteraceae bacterium]